MSRIAKLPISIPTTTKVAVSVDGDFLNVNVEGPKGKILKTFRNVVNINIADNVIRIAPINKNDKFHVIMSGTVRSILNSMIIGVEKMFHLTLNISGPGYRAALNKEFLDLALGKSHGTRILVPGDVNVDCPKLNIIKISSVNKESLGSFADLVIKQRPADVYKGNGIYKEGTLVLKKRVKKG